MKVIATAQSSTAISVGWIYETGDPEPPLSVTINEFGPDGAQMASQGPLASLGGRALFGGLMPGTTYTYQWCGLFSGEPSDQPSCVAPVPGTTNSAPPGPPKPGPPTPGPHPPGPTPPEVINIQAAAKPFGKIVISWRKNGGFASQLLLQRTQENSPVPGQQTVVTVFSANNYGSNDDVSNDSFTDTGPFAISAEYAYELITSGPFESTLIIGTPAQIYPAFFSLRKFLPANFDPSKGIKRLRPNDHPFVRVRKIMSGG
jgi:hypothetical protein